MLAQVEADTLIAMQKTFSEPVTITLHGGFDHAIDFLIPHSKTRAERIVQAISSPNRNTISAYLFSLLDTREARGQQSESYALLNDQERQIGGDILEALAAYEVKPVIWSHREQYVQALAS